MPENAVRIPEHLAEPMKRLTRITLRTLPAETAVAITNHLVANAALLKLGAKKPASSKP